MATTLNQSAVPAAPVVAEARPVMFYVSAILRYTLLTAFALLVFMPFILSFLGTFKSNAEVTAFPPTFFPKEWRPDNWTRTLNIEIPSARPFPVISNLLNTEKSFIFGRWLFNSFWLAIVNVVTQLFFCSLAAYAFARMKFPGRDLIFGFMIASMAIPGAITLIPGFVFFARLGWTQGLKSYLPLIIPSLVVPFGIFMLTQFFKSIPKELEEAAFMDGSSRFGTYWNVVLPLARPALLTLAVLQFQGSWNNFTGPLLFLRDINNMTLTVGLNYFKYGYSQDFSAILVGAMFNAIPVLIIFFIFNKYYLDSGSMTGLAGQ